jgi:hypothetical protein
MTRTSLIASGLAVLAASSQPAAVLLEGPERRAVRRGKVDAIDFGADPTGENDSTAALQRALSVAQRNQLGAVHLGPGSFRVRSLGL